MTAGRLDGTVAIVTGGAAGLGLAYARRFVAEGAFMTGQTLVVDGGSVFVVASRSAGAPAAYWTTWSARARTDAGRVTPSGSRS